MRERPSTAERVLRDPTPLAARRATQELAHTAGLDEASTQGLLTAVSEVVTNARDHGAPPVEVRARAQPDGVVVEVRDCGTGPDRPVGHRPDPARLAQGGMGLWLADQLVTHLTTARDRTGYTVRLEVVR